MYGNQPGNMPPQVPGLNGPFADGRGGYIYTDPRTGLQVDPRQTQGQYPPNYQQQPQGYPPQQPAQQNPAYYRGSYGNQQAGSYPGSPYPPQQPAPQQQYAGQVNGNRLYQSNAPAQDSGMHGRTQSAPSGILMVPDEAPEFPEANVAMSIGEPEEDELTVVDETIYVQNKLEGLTGVLAHDRRKSIVVPMMDVTRTLVNVIVDKGFEMNKNDHVVPMYNGEVEKVEEVAEPARQASNVTKLAPEPIKVTNIGAPVEANTINEASVALRGICDVEGSCMSLFDINHYIDAFNKDMKTVAEWAGSADWFNIYLSKYEDLKAESPVLIGKLDKMIVKLVNYALREVIGLPAQISDTYVNDKDDLLAYLTAQGEVDRFSKVLKSLLDNNLIPFIAEVTVGGKSVEVTGYSEVVAMYIADIEDTENLDTGLITYEHTPKLFGSVTALNALLKEREYDNPIAFIVSKNGGMVKYVVSAASSVNLAKSTIVEIK